MGVGGMRGGGRVVRMKKKRNAQKVFVGKGEERIPFGRLQRRSDHNIKTDLEKIG
jgi:hypothetical protein